MTYPLSEIYHMPDDAEAKKRPKIGCTAVSVFILRVVFACSGLYMAVSPSLADDVVTPSDGQSDPPLSLDYLKRPGIPAPSPEAVRRALAAAASSVPPRQANSPDNSMLVLAAPPPETVAVTDPPTFSNIKHSDIPAPSPEVGSQAFAASDDQIQSGMAPQPMPALIIAQRKPTEQQSIAEAAPVAATTAAPIVVSQQTAGISDTKTSDMVPAQQSDSTLVAPQKTTQDQPAPAPVASATPIVTSQPVAVTDDTKTSDAASSSQPISATAVPSNSLDAGSNNAITQNSEKTNLAPTMGSPPVMEPVKPQQVSALEDTSSLTSGATPINSGHTDTSTPTKKDLSPKAAKSKRRKKNVSTETPSSSAQAYDLSAANGVSPALDTSSPENKANLDQKATAFLRTLAGTDGVALNVAEVASPADIQEPMHLDEAVAFALKNNFEVLAADEKSGGAYWDKMGAYSQYLPSVQMAADTGPERSQPASINDANGNRVLDNTHNRRDHSITISQPLIDLGIISDILSGHDKEALADEDRRDVREGIAFDTVSIYLGLLQSRISIRLADEYKGYLDNLADRMHARVAGGAASKADLDRIRGRATAADSARIEALGQYQTDLAEFKRLTKVMPAQLVIPDVLAPAVPETMQEAMEQSLKSNPSYISSLKKIDIAEDDRNKTFSALIPKVFGQYTNSYTFNAGGAAEGNPVDGVYPTQKTQQVLLVAQWALGGTSVTGGLSSMAKMREMNLRSLDTRARIEQGVQASYTAVNAALQRQVVLQKTVEANERVVKGFEEQFKNGTRSLFDLLDAYEQLYNARLNLMRVMIANAKATYQIRRQMGELVPSILGSERR